MTEENKRLTMPGQGPTDEDLRLDAELTRQELAQTVAALGNKVDIKARAHEKAGALRDRAHEKVEALREQGDELVERLPDPVAERVRPVVRNATRTPVLPLAALLALLLLVWRLRRR
jgi:hypothetical protein